MHCQTQQGVAKGGLGSEGGEVDGGDEPRTYILTFPAKSGHRPCPVEGCSGRASTLTAMRVHFCHRYFGENVLILDEGNLSHPLRPLCDILVPSKALNGTHRCTAQCNRGAEQK